MSKNNRTIVHLNDNLDDELGWRKQELSVLKKAIPSKEGAKQRSFIRAGIAMLYAHLEGFTKVACSHYADYVKLRGITLKELKACFIARATYQTFHNKNNLERDIDKINFILDELDKRSYSRDIQIETKSNLSFEVLEEIFISIGLEVDDLIKRIHIDDHPAIDVNKLKIVVNNLMRDRNEIAHGQYSSIPITYDDFMQTYAIIISSFDGLKDYIYIAASTEAYKRTSIV